MKKFLIPVLLIAGFCTPVQAQELSLSSPDKKIVITISGQKGLAYTVWADGKIIVQPSAIDITMADGTTIGGNLSFASVRQSFVNDTIVPGVAEKRKKIADLYNRLLFDVNQNFAIEFRAYNDGIAYRIITRFKDSAIVKNEKAVFNFPGGSNIIAPLVEKREGVDIYHTSFEGLYKHTPLDSITKNNLAFSPVLVQEGGITIGLTESDLLDYPGMFLRGTGRFSLMGEFAPYPAEEHVTDDLYPEKIVTRREDFIAKIAGSRTLPWRVMLVARADKDLPGNDLVYRLASPSKIKDISWVHPGKCTDEWIVNVNLFNVPFASGVNTASYKYYIDFVKRFGFDRIMMDAGWSDYKDLFKINPDINMDTLAAYAKAKGVKISMWTDAATLDRQLDGALKQFKKWGVDFIMTDFIDRDDQKTVQFYERIAKACADAHLMIMFHGAYPPKGFTRTYPNNILRESVLGSEYDIWSDKVTPGHDLTLPFTRMLSGAFDYEPGLLDNATKDQFRMVNGKPMSQGTRCHQLAMFIVYDDPLEIFSGNPSQGYLEPKFMELTGSLPTTWDETKILDGKVGNYLVTARQKDDNWYIGGMTDWTPRDFNITLDFIGDGNYELTSCTDGINADKYAADYTISSKRVKRGDVIPVHLAAGGGFLLKLIKK
jgi:alpha-glucosidase